MPKGKLQAVHSANGVSEGEIMGLDGSKNRFYGFKGKLGKNQLVDFELFPHTVTAGLSGASKGGLVKSIGGMPTTLPQKLRKQKQGV